MSDSVNQYKIFGGNSLLDIFHTDRDDCENITDLLTQSPYFDDEQFLSYIDVNRKKFSIFSSNIASIRSKFDELDVLVHDLDEKNVRFSAICIQESWLNATDDISLFNLAGYTCFSKGKSCSNKGGLMIYLNETYDTRILDVGTFDGWELQVIEISGDNLKKKVILCNVYRPPRQLLNDYNKFIDEFTQVLNGLDDVNSDVFITGDFNINLLELNQNERINNYFNLLIGKAFKPLITLPTRYSNTSGTLIDNIFFKSSNSYNCDSGILLSKLSDHQPYFTSIDIHASQQNMPKYVKITKHSTEALNNFKMEMELCNIVDVLDHNEDCDPNENMDKLTKLINGIKEKHFPNKYVKFNNYKHKKSKWITPGILKSIKFRNSVYKKIRLTAPDSQKSIELRLNLKNYNKILKESIRRAKKHYYEYCFQNYKTNIKKAWATINEVLNNKDRHTFFPDHFNFEGEKITNKTDIANRFNSFFVNIGSNIEQNIVTADGKTYTDFLGVQPNCSFKFKAITEADTLKIINHLESKKSSSVDGINNILI